MQNIIDILYTSRDAKGIPTLSQSQWKNLNEQYDKESIISALIEYIRIYKPEPPVCNISEKDMMDCFFKLRNTEYTKFFLVFEKTKDLVMEKYDDYSKPYKDYGLGIIQMGNAYIDVSNYFNQTMRMNCDTYGFKSAHHRWKNCEDLRQVFLALWRMGNDHLNEYAFVVAFRLSTYIATQFKPHVAKSIYDMTESKKVFDSSCGWGDRLAGFYCSKDTTHYYGCDPSDQTFPMYIEQVKTYEKLLGHVPDIEISDDMFISRGSKTVQIWRKPAEDLDYSLLPEIDCAFTSPPYFSTELYNSAGNHVDDQSWKRYDTYEKWRDNFYLPVNRKTFESLKDGGIQIVNIQDPRVKNTRYYASNDLIDDMNTKYKECSFIGNLGMRIMQRPKNISKDKLTKHFKGIYIEPCWVFGKNRTALVCETKNRGLYSFME